MSLRNITLIPFVAIASLILISCGSKSDTKKQTAKKETANEIADKVDYTYQGESLKVAIIGLTHDHVHWILGREQHGDIEIVGIVEPNLNLVKRHQKQYGFSMDLVFKTMEEMIKVVKPEAVMAFNDIYGHLEVVEYFAPKGIHIMVEKPLAVSLDHAEKMIALAKKHKVQLMTNYETSWYGSNAKAFDLIHKEKKIGDIRKLVFNTGHPGPIEIGCSKEFVSWLTDPKLNGAGALTDFGCYGANLSTWFMKGETPQAVTCITQTIKPDLYPKVDDDATIILDYDKTQVVIQASWNWSHNRKDMAVYGKHGYVLCKNGEDMEVLENEKVGPKPLKALALKNGIHDPFAYFTKVIKENQPMESFGLSSLDNNLMVMQILEAAKESAKTGRTIVWDEFFANK
ncbi:Gfo/Idh/MocA family protein [Maribacter sp. HTCC2170]|uniref:Gfo/Idh/MocA family protein n=1 Tax=Maribacter sp. (strain HTCC2170 / KCCM 42371) TaxID=313603 RepID=UPI00006BD58E|nr:Gfo/Idh/MocA family oxidoreductase [Maribacter sp. HTCC2170]EAR02903.1 probable glucose-fructose oxidoreductase [Maribacter sp. HTCC2170]